MDDRRSITARELCHGRFYSCHLPLGYVHDGRIDYLPPHEVFMVLDRRDRPRARQFVEFLLGNQRGNALLWDDLAAFTEEGLEAPYVNGYEARTPA